jgi:hypothetical protein
MVLRPLDLHLYGLARGVPMASHAEACHRCGEVLSDA